MSSFYTPSLTIPTLGSLDYQNSLYSPEYFYSMVSVFQDRIEELTTTIMRLEELIRSLKKENSLLREINLSEMCENMRCGQEEYRGKQQDGGKKGLQKRGGNNFQKGMLETSRRTQLTQRSFSPKSESVTQITQDFGQKLLRHFSQTSDIWRIWSRFQQVLHLEGNQIASSRIRSLEQSVEDKYNKLVLSIAESRRNIPDIANPNQGHEISGYEATTERKEVKEKFDIMDKLLIKEL